MSVGNLKTEGTKGGTNYSWQLSVLQLLDQIVVASGGAGPTGGSTEATQLLVKTAVESIQTLLTTTARVPSMVRVTNAGVVAAGARSVSIFNAGTSNGELLGAVLKPGEMMIFDAAAQDDTVNEIAYDGTGTELVITKLV